MVARKRPLSSNSVENAPALKMAKASTNNDWRQLFELKVKIPSVAKASQNDWEPPTSAQLKWQAIINSNPTSPLTDQEQKEIFGRAHSRDIPEAGGNLENNATLNEDRSESSYKDSDEDVDKDMDEDMDEDGDEDMDEGMDMDSDYDVYKDLDWLESINGSVLSKETNTNGKPDTVGSCSSALIRRNLISHNFHDDIVEPSEETLAMGFGLFDRYGRLKPAFKKGSARSGSDIWGDEMDWGNILLIEQMRIDKRYRRQGLGREMVRVILQKALAKCNPQTFVAITRPAAIYSEIRDELESKESEEKSAIFGRERHAAECFWRSLGFRRIGYTEWFAFLPGNAQHACHTLPADKDFDPPRPIPAHRTHAIVTTLLEAFGTTKDDAARLEFTQKALGSYRPEDDVWVSVDGDGNSLLHHAAISENPACVKWIVEKCPPLVTIRNYLGETPFDSCQEHLENTRTRQQWMMKSNVASDKCTGYSQPFVEILCTLQGLSDPSLEELQQLKYGCTCGQCREGFLSPRMHFALLSTAETTTDMVLDEMDSIDGDMFLESNKEILEYLQPGVRGNMRTNKSIRQGFISIFGHFAEFLQGSKEPPRKHRILEIVVSAREWPPVTKNYLNRGGTVDAVGSALFKRAMDESQCAGDGTAWDTFSAEMKALPACRNDDEFEFVSGMCGYKC